MGVVTIVVCNVVEMDATRSSEPAAQRRYDGDEEDTRAGYGGTAEQSSNDGKQRRKRSARERDQQRSRLEQAQVVAQRSESGDRWPDQLGTVG